MLQSPEDHIIYLPIEDKELANLTGGQIQIILDHLLIESIAPIILHSDIFSHQVAYLLSVVAKNKKRKISALEREVFITYLCNYLAITDRKARLKLLTSMKMERAFIYNFVLNFLDGTKDYQSIYLSYLKNIGKMDEDRLDMKLQVIERKYNIPRENMFSTINHCKDFLNLMFEFRNNIVKNYLKYAHKAAKIFCNSKTNTMDFQDVWNNFMTVIFKAIDKYDSSKGALTSYIKWWILNVQTAPVAEHGHEYGVAYTLPQFQKKHLATLTARNLVKKEQNFGVSLDRLLGDEESSTIADFIIGDTAVDKHIIKEEEHNIVRYLAKKADPLGIARLSLDIQEYFSVKERKLMRRTMRKQLGRKMEPRSS